MRVSVSTGCLYAYPLSAIFSIAKRAGADGVELVISPEVDVRGPGYVQRLVDKYELPVLSVHPPLLEYPGWRGSFESIVPFLPRALKLTQALGVANLVLHLPRSYDGTVGIGREFLTEVVRTEARLNGNGTHLSLENRALFAERNRGLILSMPDELRAFADSSDLPLTLDTAHVASFGLDLVEAYEWFRGRLINVHLSDLSDVSEFVERRPLLHSYVKQHQLPGHGRLPLREFLNRLARDQYQGVVTLELSPIALQAWNPWQAARRLRQAVQFVRDSIG